MQIGAVTSQTLQFQAPGQQGYCRSEALAYTVPLGTGKLPLFW